MIQTTGQMARPLIVSTLPTNKHGWVRPPLNPPTVVLPRRAGPPPSKFHPFALGHLFWVSASLLRCRRVRKITNRLIWHRAASSSIFVGGSVITMTVIWVGPVPGPGWSGSGFWVRVGPGPGWSGSRPGLVRAQVGPAPGLGWSGSKLVQLGPGPGWSRRPWFTTMLNRHFPPMVYDIPNPVTR